MTVSNELVAALVVCAYVGIMGYIDISPTRIRWWWTRFLLGGAFLYSAATRGFVALLLFGGAVYLVKRSTPPWTFRLRPYVFGE